MSWTLTHSGVTQSAAAWGLTGFRRRLVSQGQDELTFRADGAAMDAAPAFAYGDAITLTNGSTRWFSGIVIELPGTGNPQGESLSYRVVGPWWYLENRVYQQAYQNVYLGLVSGTPTFASKSTSHVFPGQGLGSGSTIVKVLTGAVITEALTWALKPFTDTSTTAPFQIGIIDTGVDAPIDEVRDVTCAEVIRKMLRWTPDAIAWFDYSTSPPTFNVKRQADMTAVTLAQSTGNIEAASMSPRYDLQKSYVQIFYETRGTVNGTEYLSLITDQYPSTLPTDAASQFKALQFTVDLQGSNVSITTGQFSVETVAPTTLAWWQEKHPELRTDVTGTTVSSVTVDGSTAVRKVASGSSDSGYTKEIISGTVAPWMSVSTQRVTFTVRATVTYTNGTVEQNKLLTYSCLTTSSSGGTFTSSTVTTNAEPVPSGLAQSLYNSVNPLIWEGGVTLVESEVSGTVQLGNVLNLTGFANSAWATMNALVQTIEEDIDTGHSQIRFGPHPHLTAGDLVDLLRAARNRLITSSFSMRQNGATNSGDNGTTLGTDYPVNAPAPGNGLPSPFVVAAASNGTGSKLTLDVTSSAKLVLNNGTTDLIVLDTNGVTHKIYAQEVGYKNASCNDVKRMWLCSDEYT